MLTADWRQYNIEFPDRATAGHVAVHDLHPALTAAEDAGLLHGWWFIRKRPWRLRYLPDDPDSTAIIDVLNTLMDDGRISGWTPGVYEPETTAFGGDAAMDIAHTFFHLDSRYLLTRAAQPEAPALGQRETTALLCSTMLRAAGLDWYEQGDVWEKVAALRHADPAPLAPERAASLTTAMRRLMTADAWDLCDPADHGPLTDYGGWIGAFEHTGHALAELAHHGKLTRGLRAILAHHIIFHANRAALTEEDRATLAALASSTAFNPDADAPSPRATIHSTVRSHK